MIADAEVLTARLGYEFADQDLLCRALTHKSRAFEDNSNNPSPCQDNEQLEFLGDSILGFIVSEMLVARHPNHTEGRLSKWKAYLVSSQFLYGVAQDLDLGQFLFLGRGEEMSGGRTKRALLADAVEAVIAAIYLDGGMEAARQFVSTKIIAAFDEAQQGLEPIVVDYKSALQEAAQLLGLPLPRYAIVDEAGPEHCKTFTVEVRVGPELVARADGASKKAAGQLAAQTLLELVKPDCDGRTFG